MERLLQLRRVPLFSPLTLDQLEAIDQILSEERYLKDEIIFREGEIGSDLFVLVHGEVDVIKNHGTDAALRLSTLAPVSSVGEMAVLSDAPRSATVVAAKDTSLLKLQGDRLKELIYQMPEICFDFFRVLTTRLREADERFASLASQSESSGPVSNL